MKRFCTFVLALAAAGLSASGQAAKPGNCSPQLLAPGGLTVETDGSTITSTWNEVNDLAKEATKYSVEITAHYDGHGDVKFTFTAFDDDPGELDTASLTIDSSGLDTTVCNNPPFCTDNTTYSATSVTVEVKALNPPGKGKEQSQCNPFSAPVTESLAQACPCFNAADLADITTGGTGQYDFCWADFDLFEDGTAIGWDISSLQVLDSATAFDFRGDNPGADFQFDCRLLEDGSYTAIQYVNETQFAACTSLIEAAQAAVGCTSCQGVNCP